MTDEELAEWRKNLKAGQKVWYPSLSSNETYGWPLREDADGFFVDDRWKWSMDEVDLYPTKAMAYKALQAMWKKQGFVK